MAEIRVLSEYCKGCGLCIEVCPRGALVVSDEILPSGIRPVKAEASVECSGCTLCCIVCPDAAIEILEFMASCDEVPAGKVGGEQEKR
ncbi:MAG: 4Fe-4S binding protein [Planctomycetia bacterium]|nr:4Fe-4S binding protein [Planctomycetia bacterium]